MATITATGFPTSGRRLYEPPVLRTLSSMGDRIISLVVRKRPAVVPSTEGSLFRELDRVRTTAPVDDEEGRPIPKGSTGTVVAIWAKGAALEVEFTEPLDTLATIEPRFLQPAEREPG